MTLTVEANSPDPDLATAGMAPEEPLVAVPVAVELAVELEVDEQAPVGVTEVVTIY